MNTYLQKVSLALAIGLSAFVAQAQSAPEAKGDAPKMSFTERTAQLKASLKLTPDQEAAWKTYQEAVKPPAREVRDAWKPEEREAFLKKRTEATKAFRATLKPEQQAALDAAEAQRKASAARSN